MPRDQLRFGTGKKENNEYKAEQKFDVLGRSCLALGLICPGEFRCMSSKISLTEKNIRLFCSSGNFFSELMRSHSFRFIRIAQA